MKRLIPLLLSLLLVLSLTACALPIAEQPPQNTYELNIVTDPAPQTDPIRSSESPTAAQTSSPETTEAPAIPPQTESPASTQTTQEAPETEAVSQTEAPAQTEAADPAQELLDEDGWYDSKEQVALYIHQYGKLPGNYITKKEAEKLGWPGGSLEPYAPGKSIGGGYFGNYEGILPAKRGRTYTECDIDTAGKRSRGAKRIVFSNDGLIYYTEDHYEHFELLYGEP